MDTVYEVVAFLYEGDDVSLGYFRTRESAEAHKAEEEKGEWGGDNVEYVSVLTHTVNP